MNEYVDNCGCKKVERSEGVWQSVFDCPNHEAYFRAHFGWSVNDPVEERMATLIRRQNLDA